MKRSPIKRKARRPKPGDDPKYLRWIREQPCVVCVARIESLKAKWQPLYGLIWGNRVVEAAHFGQRAFALKPPDRNALPVCAQHHRLGPDAHHVLGSDALFEQAHGIDLAALIAEHRARYEEAMAA